MNHTASQIYNNKVENRILKRNFILIDHWFNKFYNSFISNNEIWNETYYEFLKYIKLGKFKGYPMNWYKYYINVNKLSFWGFYVK